MRSDAVGYWLEVEYADLDGWKSLTHEYLGANDRSYEERNFLDPKNGRWRITAVLGNGVSSEPTAWRYFRRSESAQAARDAIFAERMAQIQAQAQTVYTPLPSVTNLC